MPKKLFDNQSLNSSENYDEGLKELPMLNAGMRLKIMALMFF